MRSIKRVALIFFAPFLAAGGSLADDSSGHALIGKRFLTLNTIVRVRQIEVTRDTAHGPDESSLMVWNTRLPISSFKLSQSCSHGLTSGL